MNIAKMEEFAKKYGHKRADGGTEVDKMFPRPSGEQRKDSPAGEKAGEGRKGSPAGEKAGEGRKGSTAGEKAGRKDEGYPRGEKTNPNRKENEFMMNMMILRNALMAHGPYMEERAKRAGPHVWRDIRMMQATIDRIIDPILKTMPEKRDIYYSAYARNGHYELVMNGPLHHERLVLAPDRELAAVVEMAMEAECLTCFRTGNEIEKCPLRKLMVETAPPTKVRPTESEWACEYRDAAGQLIKGEEITI